MQSPTNLKAKPSNPGVRIPPDFPLDFRSMRTAEMRPTASATRFILAATACAIALLLAITLLARWFIVETPASAAERSLDIAREIASDVSDALHFQPTVVVNSETLIHQDAEAAKLITLERPITETYTWEHTWLRSTKRISVRGDFTLRAGLDLTKPFVIRIDPETGEITSDLPPAEILSVDLTNLRITRDEDGWINQLTAEDREAAIRHLRNRAILHARDSDLLTDARESAQRRLQAILATHDPTVTFDAAPTPLP